MSNIFERTERLIGKDGLEILKNSNIAVFGIGGVGSYAAEALVRSGLGSISLIDYDIIDISNINRQVHANIDTVGRFKVDIMKERLLSINPDVKIKTINKKYIIENREDFNLEEYDYIIDAIDIIKSKIDLIINAKSKDIPIISAMGAGNKLDPTQIQVSDIYSTKMCPLARVMRRELKKREIEELKVVWSSEKPLDASIEKEDSRKALPGSIAFVPGVVGMSMASQVTMDLIGFGGVL